MLYVLNCIIYEHDPVLTGLAILIWLTGGASLFILLRRALESSPRRAVQWQGVAAVTAGVGVWGTHFVAMLGYQSQVPFTFDFELTALSVLVAVVMFYLAIRVHYRLDGIMADVLGGALLSIGIAGMHFTGMSAIDAPALVVYDAPLLLGGQIVSIIAAIAAFWLLDRLPGRNGLFAAAAMSLVSVSAMHFTGMAGTLLIPDASITPVVASLQRETLVVLVCVASLLLAGLAVGSAFLDRLMNDMRGLSEATQDGLLIVRAGQILDVNGRFLTLVGLDRDKVVGQPLTDFLPVNADQDSNGVTPLVSSERRLIRPGRTSCPVDVTISVIEYRGLECQVYSLRDLSVIKESQRQISYLAMHDALTDLPNRVALDRFLEEALQAAQDRGTKVAVLALDLDSFKSVNDVFGHHEGDLVLRKVATMLRDAIRGQDMACRIGGDEFIIVQLLDKDTRGAMSLAKRIISLFEADLVGEQTLRHVGTSIGIAVYPDDADDAVPLRHAADMALYQAKETGRGTVQFYNQDIESRLRRRRELEHDLALAVANNELWLAYQPVFDSLERKMIGYEALVRWNHPRLGNIPPDQFIGIAEETGLIMGIGEWVLREACFEARSWPEETKVAVNFSAIQFWSQNVVEVVSRALEDSGVSAKRLEIELTESVVLRDNAQVDSAINGLRALGVSIVMDDFGTGFSALSDLQRYPFDKIKIDRSFVMDVENDGSKQAIIRAIVSMGRAMRLPVVAEGVETEAQLAMVAMAGCSQVQGYLLGRPGAAPSLSMEQRPSLRVV